MSQQPYLSAQPWRLCGDIKLLELAPMDADAMEELIIRRRRAAQGVPFYADKFVQTNQHGEPNEEGAQ